MEWIEGRSVAGIVPGLALALVPILAPVPGPGALAGQEEPRDTTAAPVPAPAEAGDEERLYGPSKVLGCDLDFAVLASTVGEPATVRACPRAGGGRDAYFGPGPIVAPRHIDSVAVGPDGSGGREVVVRLTEAGGREMAEYRDAGLSERVGVVVGGEVTAGFALRASGAARRIVAASGVGPERAGAVAAHLRASAARARAWWGDRLWRLEWAPRPGGRLDRALRGGEADLAELCPRDDLACWRDRHRPREVLLDTLRRDPEPGAAAAGVLAVRTAVRWSPDTRVAALGLDLVFRPTDGEEATVLRPLGDWSYGVAFLVPARRGSRVPVPGTGGWLDASSGRIRGEVRSAEGGLVTLEAPVRGERVSPGGGVRRSGGEARVAPGGYVVARTADGFVWLREERPADFELGCRGIADTVAGGERPDPELYRVAIPDLYRPGDGAPVIRDSYPRGC